MAVYTGQYYNDMWMGNNRSSIQNGQNGNDNLLIKAIRHSHSVRNQCICLFISCGFIALISTNYTGTQKGMTTQACRWLHQEWLSACSHLQKNNTCMHSRSIQLQPLFLYFYYTGIYTKSDKENRKEKEKRRGENHNRNNDR